MANVRPVLVVVCTFVCLVTVFQGVHRYPCPLNEQTFPVRPERDRPRIVDIVESSEHGVQIRNRLGHILIQMRYAIYLLYGI